MNNLLLEAYYLNHKLKLKNRFVMAPMTTWSEDENGKISMSELKHYKYRSKVLVWLLQRQLILNQGAKDLVGSSMVVMT